ncbi:unnamed protein product, partial [Ilex paraguariensis]
MIYHHEKCSKNYHCQHRLHHCLCKVKIDGEEPDYMSYGWLHQNWQASEAQCDQYLGQMKHVMINAVQQNSVQVWSDHRKYDYPEHNENDSDLRYDQPFCKFDSEVGYDVKKLDYGESYFHSHNEGKRISCHVDDHDGSHDVDLGNYHVFNQCSSDYHCWIDRLLEQIQIIVHQQGQWAWMIENGSTSNVAHELIVMPEDHQ